jgi:hypothetical protein
MVFTLDSGNSQSAAVLPLKFSGCADLPQQ